MINGGVSFWHAELGGPPTRRPALPGDTTADICIVGAGYTGLWTAYYLKHAEPALDIVIVEKEFAGFGASGRNGGWLSGGFGWSRDKYREGTSREAVVAMERTMRDGVDEVASVVARDDIDADLIRVDQLTVAVNGAQLSRLRETYAAARGWQVPEDRIRLVGRDEALSRIRVDNAVGGLLRSGAARVQPAKLARGLAAAVERLGVRIFEGTPALSIDRGRVQTRHGTVRTPIAIRATEGFTAGLPGTRRSWLPMNSAMIATAPLSAAQWEEIGWTHSELLSSAFHVYAYAQRTREGRIAIGGRGVPYRFGSRTDRNGRTQDATVAQLKSMLRTLLPQTREVAIDHAWCGVLGVPRDWCATVGFDRAAGFGWAGGYVGQGVTTSNVAGRTLADLVLSRDTELTRLPWVNRTVRPWEPEPLRWLGVTAMYGLYALADRHEAGGLPRTSRLAAFANRLTGR